MIFQIFALFVTDIGFDYIAPNPTGDDLTSFFETVARKNWLDIDGVTFSEGDTFLTLSTCCRKYDKANSGNQRLVVMAKLLPEGRNRRSPVKLVILHEFVKSMPRKEIKSGNTRISRAHALHLHEFVGKSSSMRPATRRARTGRRRSIFTTRASEPWKCQKSRHQWKNEKTVQPKLYRSLFPHDVFLSGVAFRPPFFCRKMSAFSSCNSFLIVVS